MTKTKFVLSLLAVSTSCIQAEQIDIHETLKNIQSNPAQVHIDLLQQRKETVEKKQKDNKGRMVWGAGQTVAGVITVVFCLSNEKTLRSLNLPLAHTLFFGSILTAGNGIGQLCRGAYGLGRHNAEYNNEINAIEKALATLQ